jgi:hypothetical protein
MRVHVRPVGSEISSATTSSPRELVNILIEKRQFQLAACGALRTKRRAFGEGQSPFCNRCRQKGSLQRL